MRKTRSEYALILAGAAAPFVGVGLGRFAYNPLFPEMVSAGWLLPAGGGYVGAFNLAGYLSGVMMGRSVAARAGVPFTINAAMGLMALSFLASAVNLGLAWLCGARFLAGFSGGVLMVLAGPVVQSCVSAGRRGIAGGIVISGVGTGIIFGAAIMPLLLGFGIVGAWTGLALITLAIWGLTCRLWPAVSISAGFGMTVTARNARLMVAAYGLAGAGMVPHMVYLSDLFIRGRGYSFGLASAAWLLFGVGAILGSLLGGKAVDRLGGYRATLIWLAVQIAGIALLLIWGKQAALAAGFLGGFGGIGLTGVVLGYAHELNPAISGIIWKAATAAFAICQAVGSFALAFLFDISQSHLPVVVAGLLLSAAAFGLLVISPRNAPGKS